MFMEGGESMLLDCGDIDGCDDEECGGSEAIPFLLQWRELVPR